MKKKPLPLHEPRFFGNEVEYLNKSIRSTWVSTSGEYIKKFEKQVATYTGKKYAIACNSGTSSLHISLLVAGVGSGDEVIVPTLTFIAPINAVKYVNANPIFMDCDEYFNIDLIKTIEFIKKETEFKKGFSFNKKTGKKVKAIIAVHIFGNAVELIKIKNLCKKRNILIIEDCSESLGTFVRKKNRLVHTGNIGEMSCLSFNGNKIITAGAGGMILTDVKNFERRIRYLIRQAKDDELDFIHNDIGYNYSQTNIHAAIGYAQMKNIKQILKKKKKIYLNYVSLFKNNDNFDIYSVPTYAENNHWLNILKIKNIKVNNKKKLIVKLIRNKIFVRPIWKLNHLQLKYRKYQTYRISKSVELVSNSICLPSSYHLSINDLKRVIKEISE